MPTPHFGNAEQVAREELPKIERAERSGSQSTWAIVVSRAIERVELHAGCEIFELVDDGSGQLGNATGRLIEIAALRKEKRESRDIYE